MVFVIHDVEPHLLCLAPEIEIPVVQLITAFGVEIAVGEIHTDRIIGFLIRQVGIGVFGKPVNTHFLAPYPAKSTTCLTNSSGCSACGEWPASGIVTKSAPSIISA